MEPVRAEFTFEDAMKVDCQFTCGPIIGLASQGHRRATIYGYEHGV